MPVCTGAHAAAARGRDRTTRSPASYERSKATIVPPSEPLLRVKNLIKHFPLKGGLLVAQCRAASMPSTASASTSAAARRWGWSANPGCGKSTTGRCILRLIEPTSGEIWFEGEDVDGAVRRRTARAAPRHADHLSGSLRLAQSAHDGRRDHRRGARSSTGSREPGRPFEDRVVELLETVGLSADHMRRYPHEFSGGQRQRIGIARALAVSRS